MGIYEWKSINLKNERQALFFLRWELVVLYSLDFKRCGNVSTTDYILTSFVIYEGFQIERTGSLTSFKASFS